MSNIQIQKGQRVTFVDGKGQTRTGVVRWTDNYQGRLSKTSIMLDMPDGDPVPCAVFTNQLEIDYSQPKQEQS